jgi:hypothetical protein
LGVNTRQINISRGSKEGDTALVPTFLSPTSDVDNEFRNIAYNNKNISTELINYLIIEDQNFQHFLSYDGFYNFLESGIPIF